MNKVGKLLFAAVFLASMGGAPAGCNKGQSLSQAMEKICEGAPLPDWFSKLAPPDRMAASSRLFEEQRAWFEKNVTNTKARKLMAKLASIEPYRWSWELSETARRANVRPCPFVRTLGPAVPSEVPVVSGRHLDGVDTLPLISITRDAISSNGEVIVRLKNGQIDDWDLEGGAMGIQIKRLMSFRHTPQAQDEPRVQTFSEDGGPAGLAINLHLEPNTPQRLLFGTIASLRSAEPPYHHFNLLVASKEGTLGALPIDLPRPLSFDEEQPDAARVQLILSLTDKRLVLWSVSGLEGTLTDPVLSSDRDPANAHWFDLGKVSAKLAEIEERQWPGGEGAPHELLVQAHAELPYRVLAELLSEIQKTASGEPRFITPLAMSTF